jgi:3-isopropylmalate/(R)-2-methylmalate dehydratase large subunit
MASTAAEKIFARHSGKDRASAGEIVFARPDRMLLNDITGPLAFELLAAMGVERVRDPEKIVLVGDHFAPPKDIAAAEGLRSLQQFAAANNIEHAYDVGNGGIEHTLMPELGLIRPGALVIGGDSHTSTCGAFGAIGIGMGSADIAAAIALGELWFRVPETMLIEFSGRRNAYVTGKDLILAVLGDISANGANYRCMEFTGSALADITIDERMAVCNMTAEGSAKTCVVPADEVTLAWAAEKKLGPIETIASDKGADIADHRRYDVSRLEPLCARPYMPDNVVPVSEVRSVKVDQVYIGNCANGTLTDLRQAAEIFEGRRVARNVRCVVVPATQRIHREAMREGIIEILIDAGCVISPSTCGACAGLHMGVLADNQVAVATTNRNYRGRMGAVGSKVYLANAWVAAASAVAGEIVHPADVRRTEAAE